MNRAPKIEFKRQGRMVLAALHNTQAAICVVTIMSRSCHAFDTVKLDDQGRWRNLQRIDGFTVSMARAARATPSLARCGIERISGDIVVADPGWKIC